MIKHSLILAALLSTLTFTHLVANEVTDDALSGFDDLGGFDEEESDELSGFDDGDTQEVESESTSSYKSELFSLSGNVAFKTSSGYRGHKVDGVEYGGINQAQTSLYLQLDSKLSDDWKVRISGDVFYDAIYDIRSNNDYSQDVLDAYQTQVRLDDTYVQGRLTKDIDIKVGRQVVVWGKSDSIRITDVINPLDNRLPGMTDIEDLRLSVAMAKLDYYVGSWNLSAMAIGESRTMIEATPQGEFFPIEKLGITLQSPLSDITTPDYSMDNMQYAFAANGVFSGWDLSFYAADVLDQKWYIDQSTATRKVAKVKMLGSAINIATGSWLLKSEVAVISGVKYNTTLDEKNRLDVLVAFDYMGIKDVVLSLEVADRHIFDYENQLSIAFDYVDEDEIQTAARATQSFMNDSLNATALLSMFGSTFQNGGFARFWVEYDIMDALTTNVGLVEYVGGDKPIMEANSENDRIFADITYSF